MAAERSRKGPAQGGGPAPTIADVARRAGVSASTVSNVLNGRVDRMRAQTLQRVEAAIRALGFRPSALARQLKTGETPLIGLLVPSLTNPMYVHIAREVEAAAHELGGRRLLIGSTYRDRKREAAFLDDLSSLGVRRVIVISALTDERHFDLAAQRGMAIVSYDRLADPGRPGATRHVTPDNFEAARMATQYLIDRGHRRLAFATVAGMTLSRAAKIAGFRAAVDGAGLRRNAAVIDGGALDEYGDSVIADVGRSLGVRITATARPPTGVVALNDLMALGLMAGLREGGLHVPMHVSIVGIDGMSLSAFSAPPLTTVRLPVRAMARAMVQAVEARDVGRAGPGTERVFSPEGVMERASVAVLPGKPVDRALRLRRAR